MIEATAESPLSPLPAPTRLTPRRRLDGRELLATAKGILIAARRCSDARAFDELLDVSRRHHLTVVGAARNLVDLAAGSPSSRCAPDAVRFDEWEQLLAQLPPAPARTRELTRRHSPNAVAKSNPHQHHIETDHAYGVQIHSHTFRRAADDVPAPESHHVAFSLACRAS